MGWREEKRRLEARIESLEHRLQQVDGVPPGMQVKPLPFVKYDTATLDQRVQALEDDSMMRVVEEVERLLGDRAQADASKGD